VLCDGEIVRFERSMSCIESVETCCAFGVSYDSEMSNVVCVVAWESSVVISSTPSRPDGCSSYPDNETFALASKNCFQNYYIREHATDRVVYRITFDPSHTSLECSAYCSTIGMMLDVTILCALLKLWSISCRVRVMDCSRRSNSSVKVRGRC